MCFENNKFVQKLSLFHPDREIEIRNNQMDSIFSDGTSLVSSAVSVENGYNLQSFMIMPEK